jgi:hypothetical protein
MCPRIGLSVMPLQSTWEAFRARRDRRRNPVVAAHKSPPSAARDTGKGNG